MTKTKPETQKLINTLGSAAHGDQPALINFLTA